MPTTKTFAAETGLPRLRRWKGPKGIYQQVRESMASQKPEDGTGQDLPPMNELFSDPGSGALWEISFQKCLRKVERWWQGLPDTQQYAADTVLEKRLRPDFALPPAPKPSLVSAASEIRADLQARVVAEGIVVNGSAETPGIYVQDVLNASHFSNDPGSWDSAHAAEPQYRAVPRALLIELLDAYPRAGQANTRTEACADAVSWLYAHGVTAAGQLDGRGRYVFAIVQNEGTGKMAVVVYDPHVYQRILDPDFRATPDEVHSGKYNGYREGPYDTKYGGVFI